MPQPVRLRMRFPAPAPRTSLCDALDKLLDTGIVVAGELTIKVADVELLYVAVELVAGSWESMHRVRRPTPTPLCKCVGRARAGAACATREDR